MSQQAAVQQADMREIAAELSADPEIQVRQGMRGADLTTFAIGGPLAAVVDCPSLGALQRAVACMAGAGAPYRVIGAGSNLLVSDEGVSGFVIRLGAGLRAIEELPAASGTARLAAGGAAALMTLSRRAARDGLSGLEFAGGIPASIGGAVYMNAGAHGRELCEVLERIMLVLPDGEYTELPANRLAFSYRHSGVPAGAIVCGAVLALRRGDPAEIEARRAEFLAERKRKQPLSAPCAGSIFRNPEPDRTAGALIDACGLRGAMAGGAQISLLHANWIVNPARRARAEHVIELIERARESVRDKFNVELEPEVVRWV